ncbi:DUF4430 domain-containing protein [Enterococcus casseliflavus]|uniref:DUF4430 domain-containing protein n=1 Tax=Enterococcus casseliflavus TaxID=37734 RepID=UPI0011A64E7F|nr:DUF4430 domain-containing protein [Enterococcus casseliflavus]
MKKTVVFSYIFLLSLVFAGCAKPSMDAGNSSSESSSVQQNAEERTAQISFNNKSEEKDQEIETKTVTFKEGVSLMTIMKENFDLEENQGMITSIDGLAQDEKAGYYWTYTINDEMITTGADDTFLGNNDKVVFTYEKFE